MTEPKRAKGGKVPGSHGSPTDDRLCVVSPGHAVVPDDTLAKYWEGLFVALNGGPTDVQSASDAVAEMDQDDTP